MKHSYLQFKRSAFLFLIASALFGKVSAQSDSLRSARTDGTQSVNGTVTYDGTGAGTTGEYGTFFGNYAGRINTAEKNSFIGGLSGYSNTTGRFNTFLGYKAGYSNSTGQENTFLGTVAGQNNTTGNYNVFLGGTSTGTANTTGSANVFVGNAAGAVNTTGNNNTYVGAGAGLYNPAGSGNVFLGIRAGMNSTESNKLIISNTETVNPLIYGDFTSKNLIFNGKVGVNTSVFPASVGGADVSAYQLFVKGGILTEEVRVRSGWADYVFKDNYNLKTLSEVEDFILRHGHLPNIPKASQVETQGLDLGRISVLQQEKIEELTLYAIDQQKKIEDQKQRLSILENQVVQLKELIQSLIDKK